jgi:hypothetical protein
MVNPKYPHRRQSSGEPCRIVRIETSLTEKEEERYQGYADYEGLSLNDWLRSCLNHGIDSRIEGLLQDQELKEGIERMECETAQPPEEQQ